MSEIKHTPGICIHCGTDKGLHHYRTFQCPLNGKEETREGRKQEYHDTIFEEINPLHTAAPDMLEALKQIQNLATINSVTVGSVQGANILQIAKAAIEKAQPK